MAAAWPATLCPVPWYWMCGDSGSEGEGLMAVANRGAPGLREWCQTCAPVAYICV